MYKRTSIGIPYLASTIITAGDKLISIFIEAAVGERQYMSF